MVNSFKSALKENYKLYRVYIPAYNQQIFAKSKEDAIKRFDKNVYDLANTNNEDYLQTIAKEIKE